MKNSIKLTALFLLASATIFAAVPAKAMVSSKANDVVFSATPSQNGVSVKVTEAAAAKAIVMIYDIDGNVIRKDVLSNTKGLEKAYVLNKLENGDYTIEVTSNGETVKKAIHVYDEDQTKMFIIKG